MSRLPNYGIRSDYHARHHVQHWDDRGYRDQHQRHVYELARHVMKENKYRSILDIGTGSGWKLVHLLGEFETIGTEIQPVYDFLRQQYPDRQWLLSDLSQPCPVHEVDLVMAADVIEHLVDPDLLMEYIRSIRWKRCILSTPDRDRVRGPQDLGPPANPCHAREWNAEEFTRYISQWIYIESMRHYGGSMVFICKPFSEQ